MDPAALTLMDEVPFAGVLALLAPLVLVLLGLAVLYIVIRRAVAAGVRDAHRQEVGAVPATED